MRVGVALGLARSPAQVALAPLRSGILGVGHGARGGLAQVFLEQRLVDGCQTVLVLGPEKRKKVRGARVAIRPLDVEWLARAHLNGRRERVGALAAWADR